MKTHSPRTTQWQRSSTPQQDAPQESQSVLPPAYGIDFVDQQQYPIQTVMDSESAVTSTTPAVANRTGLPDTLKSGIEQLSGYQMDDVKVHYNSSRPAQLQALAYAQGTDIHLAPGQEQHLPHEAWHVVQQKQGRVRATRQLKGVKVNDEVGLEREADVMGARAKRSGGAAFAENQSLRSNDSRVEVVQRFAITDDPIDWTEIREVKLLKEGKVILLVGNDGNKLILKTEKGDYETLAASQKIISDLNAAHVPDIKQLTPTETARLTGFLQENHSAEALAFNQEILQRIGQSGFIYLMEFLEGTDLEQVGEADGLQAVLNKLTSGLMNKLGRLHAIDLFVGNKDRGFINLGNWMLSDAGELYALDNSDSNSMTNKFLLQLPTAEEDSMLLHHDLQETANKLSNPAYLKQEIKWQFETNLPRQLAANKGINESEDTIRAKIIETLGPYSDYEAGLFEATIQILAEMPRSDNKAIRTRAESIRDDGNLKARQDGDI